jgi:ketosteroid isomerase-like protein
MEEYMADNSNRIQRRTLVENWARAVRGGDMDGVLAHHTDDIVMFDVPLPLQPNLSKRGKTFEI